MSMIRERSSVISKVKVFKAASYAAMIAATMLCTDAVSSAAAVLEMSNDDKE